LAEGGCARLDLAILQLAVVTGIVVVVVALGMVAAVACRDFLYQTESTLENNYKTILCLNPLMLVQV
jgi:hypothetical protein